MNANKCQHLLPGQIIVNQSHRLDRLLESGCIGLSELEYACDFGNASTNLKMVNNVNRSNAETPLVNPSQSICEHNASPHIELCAQASTNLIMYVKGILCGVQDSSMVPNVVKGIDACWSK